ncbi:hypothetical protein BD770DRAFT_470383 [Pilaira anomala]|nr:hypothetical protein BD770DRAFT_470383 [Pilaira anomala]
MSNTNSVSSSDTVDNKANDTLLHAAHVTLSESPVIISVPTTGYTSTIVIHGKTQQIVVSLKELSQDGIPHCYRKGKKLPFSQYWIPKENEWDENNHGKRVYLAGDEKKKPLLDKDKNQIGMVSVDMYDKCEMEGTCLLENGDLINIDNSTKSFIKVGGQGRRNNVFGLGSGSQNLVPFVSVAVNDIPLGKTLYIEKLDGLDLDGQQKHNGCVRVDDDSWSFDSCQIDFFVLSYVDYLWLNLDEKVSVEVKDCQVKNYVTRNHLAHVKASTDQSIIPSLLDAKYQP